MNSTYKKPVIAGLNVRSVLIDVFKEAQHAGEASPGYLHVYLSRYTSHRRTIPGQALSLQTDVRGDSG